MCLSTAKWQREEVQDHKFDFVDVEEFHKNSCVLRLKYFFVFAIVLKYVLVYIADIWTAGILLIFDRWSSSVQPAIPFFISKWIYVGCIFMSFILLAWDVKKANHIIKSRDISYAFTNVVAYRYYTLGSYSHFCFFDKINNSKKIVDYIAFFVFFTFKGWKRLVFAEAPRQIINAITLYSIIRSNKSRNYFDINEYGTDIVQRLVMGLMAFSLLVFTVSASMFIFAFLLYIPLLCQIRGNLKEYCCHKIDKRISELLKKNSKKRIRKRQLQARAEAARDLSHSNKNASIPVITPHRQPTLPNVDPQKIISPEPIRMNYSPHGQNPDGRQIQRSDTNNYSPYKNNTTVPYNLSGPGYPQKPQQPPQPYTRKTPPPGGPQRGYNNLAAMSEPIPQIYNAKPEPIPQIHVKRSEPIPQIHVTRSEPIPQIHVTKSEPIPQIHVTRSESVPQIHVTRPEPIPQIHVTESEPIPRSGVTMSEPIHRSDVTMSEILPPIRRPTPQQYVAALEPMHVVASQTTEPTEPSYDSTDIIDNYRDSDVSNYTDSSYGYYVSNNYTHNSNSSYNSYNNHNIDNNYDYNTDSSYNNYNYTNNNYIGHNYTGNNSRIGVDGNFASNPLRPSNDRYQPSNQMTPRVNQPIYDAQREIEEGYYYAQ